MSSPAESDRSNSFEDAQNGNSKEGKPEATASQENPITAGEAAGVLGAGITLSEDDIAYLMQGGRVGSSERPTGASNLANPAQLPPPPPIARTTRTTDDEGLGASSTDDHSSPNQPDSTRVSSTEVSPTSRGGSTGQYRPGQPRSMFGDRPPSLSPKGASSFNQQSLPRYGAKEAEPAMAVGVANVDIDTASLAHTDTASLGLGPSQDADATVANDCWCWLCSRYGSCRRWCQCCRCPRLSPLMCTLFSMTVLLASCALVLVTYFYMGPYVNNRIKEALVLKPGVPQWEQPRAKIVADVYLFNLSNPEDFMDGGQLPVLSQVGPYSFRVNVEKINISWNTNGTVSYRERHTFEFDEEKSGGSQYDRITTANVPLLAVDDYVGLGTLLLNQLLSRKARRLVERHSVRELIWGYQNSALQEIKTMANQAPFSFLHLAEEIPSTIGVLLKDNSSVSRMFNVYTGADNFSRLNDIYSWDYNRKLPFWSTDEANLIQGTDGSVFKPFLNEDSQVTFFFAQLFRSFRLEYRESRSKRGLNTLRYIIPDSQFFNSTFQKPEQAAARPLDLRDSMDRQENWQLGLDEDLDKPRGHKSGYCVPECVPNGVYSIEPCTHAPLYISLPHFLGADPFYLSQVSGLTPQEDKHRPVFDVDSLTGVIVSNYRRYQLNVRLNAGKSGDTFLPVFWVDVRAELDKDTLQQLLKASNAKLAVDIVTIVAVSAVVVFFLVTIGLIVYNLVCARRNRYEALSSNSVGRS